MKPGIVPRRPNDPAAMSDCYGKLMPRKLAL